MLLSSARSFSPAPSAARTLSPRMSDPKFGTDPRAMLPDPPVMPYWKPGFVTGLRSTGELIGAIEATKTDGTFLAVKFWRDGCKACGATVEAFEQAARDHPKGRFHLINFGECKDLCRGIGLKVVPTGHLYASGELVDAMALGPSKWSDFAAKVEEVAKS